MVIMVIPAYLLSPVPRSPVDLLYPPLRASADFRRNSCSIRTDWGILTQLCGILEPTYIYMVQIDKVVLDTH